MKFLKVISISFLVLLFAPAINCAVQQLTTKEEFKSHLESVEPTVIYCTASWCTACTEQMTPVINQAATKFAGKVKFVSVDYDKHTDMCKELEITGLPRMIFAQKGKERIIQGGSRPQHCFDYSVEQFLKGELKPDVVVTTPSKPTRNNGKKRKR